MPFNTEVNGKSFEGMKGVEFENGKAEVKLTINGNSSGFITIKGLPTGRYTVTEEYTEVPGHTWTFTVDGSEKEQPEAEAKAKAEIEVEKEADKSVSFTNTYTRQKGNLAIDKTVTGLSGEATKAKRTFTFILKAEDTADEVNGKNFTGMGDKRFVDGEVTIEIPITGNGKDRVTIKGLPTGNYTVTEAESEKPENHELIVIANGKEGGLAEVEVKPDSTEEVKVAEAYFTNTYVPYGSLTVVKAVDGPASAITTQEYSFEITGVTTRNLPVTGSYSTMSGTEKVEFNSEGKAEITITGADTCTIIGLPLGSYTVTEIGDAGIDGYEWTVSVSVDGVETNEGNAEVTADAAAIVTITNTYVPYGSLTVIKTVSGLKDTEEEQVYYFTITGKDAKGNPVNGEYTMGKGTVEFKDGVAEITIKGAGRVTIEQLPLGEYTVTEDTEKAAVDGYKLDAVGNGVTVTVNAAGGKAEVSIDNQYTETTSLTVNKVWRDGADKHVDGSVTVKIMNGDEIVKTVILNADNNWTHTESDLPLGNYTVVEEAVKGYTPSYKKNEDGSITITNTPDGPSRGPGPETTSLTVNKVWSDGADRHVDGSVTVNIIGGGIVRTVVLSAANGWTATVNGLTKNLSYTVQEVAVEGYTPSYTTNADGSVTITNTYEEEEIPTPTPVVVTPTPTPEVTPEPTPEVTPTPTPVVEIPEEETPLDTPEVSPTPTPVVEIPEEETPLGTPEVSPTPTPMPTPVIEIPDEETPLADGSPKTGDSSVTWLWAMLSLLSAGIAMVLLPKRKRQK